MSRLLLLPPPPPQSPLEKSSHIPPPPKTYHKMGTTATTTKTATITNHNYLNLPNQSTPGGSVRVPLLWAETQGALVNNHRDQAMPTWFFWLSIRPEWYTVSILISIYAVLYWLIWRKKGVDAKRFHGATITRSHCVRKYTDRMGNNMNIQWYVHVRTVVTCRCHTRYRYLFSQLI